MDNFSEKPELVKSDSGFSVFYKDKFLYSKRNPQKAILNLAENTVIPEETLVLCVSPVLGYGLDALFQKIPESCFAVAVEADKELFALAERPEAQNILRSGNLLYVQTDAVPRFLKEIRPAVEEKKLRRVLRLDFSAGAFLHSEFYSRLTNFTQDYISRYWINRLTLIRFGRNYARNFFKNYTLIERTETNGHSCGRFGFLKTGRVQKPVLVLGAGPSLDSAVEFIVKNRKNLFVLAVDAACRGLYPAVRPDAAVLLESQYWIQKAFIGLKDTKIPVFADLTANPAALSCTGGRVDFFFTDYADNGFFDELKNGRILPVCFEPMGSVGLTALKLAEKISAENVPVFHTGLDFSWKKGFTHSKFSFHVSETFTANGRFSPLYTPENLFQDSFRPAKEKNGSLCVTSPVLQGYAEIYRYGFSHKSNLFDIADSGLSMNSNVKTFGEAEKIIEAYFKNVRLAEKTVQNGYFENNDGTVHAEKSASETGKIPAFLSAQKNKLKELKDIFTGQKSACGDYIKELLLSVPYLYLHFPDYSAKNIMNKHFLNRVRIELEYFLKILNRESE